jgi:hypothetical protein
MIEYTLLFTNASATDIMHVQLRPVTHVVLGVEVR